MGNTSSYIKEYNITRDKLEDLSSSHSQFVKKHSQLRQKYISLNENNGLLLNENKLLRKNNEQLSKEIEKLRDDNSEYSYDITRYLLIIDKFKEKLRLLNDKTLMTDFIKENNNTMLDDDFEKDYLEAFVNYLINKMQKEVEHFLKN